MNAYSVPPRSHKPPETLPAGWWDALQSLAEWVRSALFDAYESGYMAGKLDALRAYHDAADEPPEVVKSSDEIAAFLRGFRKPS